MGSPSKLTAMKTKMLLALSVVGLVAAFAPQAQAGSSFHFSIGLPVYAPARVVVTQPMCAPPVVYCPPRTVYYPPVVYAPACGPRGGYGYYGGGHRHGGGHGYRQGHRGGHR